ncbi:hypothetical protein AA101099_0615 [Neoasaia chiangmaiensis NBRC 101099]|uniref:Uncharacterized protein n=1 Tax=Neoasaia chiangmaiensis TaxID=320497 RepID=A0A1U9KLD6_9PROT|nr:hypothetical protein A0U93_00035 [Neoasaia chiangmaiensis]GBR37144.1 hypothetical protein AA101099_0615 [Neoasaia chiangmaiensis NBRC 101099]GEN16489.1 hypothetical protein NCH01_29200 [Neoasaia chiangmaiensis]
MNLDGVVPGLQAGKRFLFVASPHRRCGNAERATFRPDRVAEMIVTIGTVGENLARIGGHDVRTCASIVDVGWRYRDPLDQSRRGIGADIGLETMHGLGPLCFTQRASPSCSVCDAMIVASTIVPVLIQIACAFN